MESAGRTCSFGSVPDNQLTSYGGTSSHPDLANNLYLFPLNEQSPGSSGLLSLFVADKSSLLASVTA